MVEVFYLSNGRRIYVYLDFTAQEIFELISANRVTKGGRHYFLKPDTTNKFKVQFAI
jgi:hypothetical protein